MKVIYRISDGSYIKNKLPNVTKRHCLLNFLSHWRADEITVLADKINDDTREFLQECQDLGGLDVRHIQGGSSAQSFRISMELARSFDDDEPVYLVEDDYLHLDHSRKCLLEAIKIADYVTLTDYPDKYRTETGGAGTCRHVNPLITERGEITQVVITESRHWKLTNSTTCTFATTPRVLKDDWDIWTKHCFSHPDQTHPHDFQCFLELRAKGRSLLSPIPTLATHGEVEYLAPLVDWANV
jgi:hypothetical protein